jgi:hypothetical protein
MAEDVYKAEQAVIQAATALGLTDNPPLPLDESGRYHGFTDYFTTGHDLWALRTALLMLERVKAGEPYREPVAPCDCREGLWIRTSSPTSVEVTRA